MTDAAWLIYLGSPYTHDDWGVRRERADTVCEVAAALLGAGHIVYSPIAHGHAVDGACGHTLPDTQAFWMRHCLRILSSCDELVVCTLDGWRDSAGLATEIDYAREHDMPIRYVDADRPLELRYLSVREAVGKVA